MSKLHLCCGDIYLSGYINIDIKGKKPPRNNPNLTTLNNYYNGRSIGLAKKPIVDREMDILKWDYPRNSLDEVLMISSFEHLSRDEAKKLVKNIYTSLKSGGKFKFDFPDMEQTVKQFSDEAMIRLIYGSYKNPYSIHKWGYTKNTIKRVFNGAKWSVIEFKDIVKHDYPMQGVVLTK